MQNLPHVIFSISLRAVIFALCPGVTDLQFAAGKHYKQPAASMTCDPRRGGFHMCQFFYIKTENERERERDMLVCIGHVLQICRTPQHCFLSDTSTGLYCTTTITSMCLTTQRKMLLPRVCIFIAQET